MVTGKIVDVRCTWASSGMNFGRREVVIRIPYCGAACNCPKVGKTCITATPPEVCRIYEPHVPTKYVLHEEIANPVAVKDIVAHIYKLYALQDLTALRVAGGEPFHPENFPWVKELITTLRSNEEEDIRIILETSGSDMKLFLAHADFFMDNEVGILLKTHIPPTPTEATDRLFEAAAYCLSTIVGNAMGGAWLTDYALQIAVTAGSDVRRITEYLDAIHANFANAKIANDLVKVVLVGAMKKGGKDIFPVVDAVSGLAAEYFGSSNVRVTFSERECLNYSKKKKKKVANKKRC